MEEKERLKTGFDADDLFQRRGIVFNLTDVVNANEHCKVIAIDSEWGSGKTTFLKNWKDYLEKNESNTKCIFFDAWENDFYTDPIVPIVGILEELLDINEVDSRDVKMAFISIMSEIIKNMTLSTVDLAKLKTELMNSTRKDLDLYKSLNDEKELILQKLSQVSKDKKVYIFIDELDRCRPTFSINLLERIKHYFRIPNFVFVLGVDIRQLGYSAQSLYGNIDAHSYFKKLFDIVVNLPEPSAEVFLDNLLNQMKNEYILDRDCEEVLKLLVKHNPRVTLRECEKIVDILKIASTHIKSSPFESFVYPIMIYLKVVVPEDYRNFLNGTLLLNADYLERFNIEKVCPGWHEQFYAVYNVLSINNAEERYIKQKEIKQGIFHKFSLVDLANRTLEFKY